MVAEQSARAKGEWVDPALRRVTVGDLGDKLLATKLDPNTRDWYRWALGRAAGAGPDTVRGAFRALHEVVSVGLRSRIIGHDPCLVVAGASERVAGPWAESLAAWAFGLSGPIAGRPPLMIL